MRLDGDRVETGDKVHHITLGTGTVETIHQGTARVRMERGDGIVNMGEDGTINGKKVFYWGEPVLVAPRKNQRAMVDKASALMLEALNLVADERRALSVADLKDRGIL